MHVNWALKVKQMFAGWRRGTVQLESRELPRSINKTCREGIQPCGWMSRPGTERESKADTASQKARVCFRVFRFLHIAL